MVIAIMGYPEQDGRADCLGPTLVFVMEVSMNGKGKMKWVVAAVLVAMAAWGCGSEGPAGKDGAPGQDGAPGKDGEPGKDGKDGVDGKDGAPGKDGVDGKDGKDGLNGGVPAYIGSEACGDCHADQYAEFIKSGHPYKLTKVEGGVAPTRPFDSITGGVPDPPLGLTWNDISYVIGGFGWKARYVGTDGYIVTGGADDATQWNFPNEVLGTDGGWVPYHAGQQKPYDCGTCHTTGWIPCPVGDTTCKHQDDMEGMAGSFFAGGVQCEACHGPGSLHAADPYFVEVKVDRDSELCGQCHIRGEVETVDAKGGFIKHHEQWEEMFQSKKFAMRCVDCHDPHKSAKFADAEVNPEKSIRRACTTCHVGFDSNQKSAAMQALAECEDCHMPRI
ncbi:MAG: hypothetical protein GXP54_06985 [Deltaproteobacteria bacterium]|nr:hypothetical protein [Deltaproteobacteria bacterium]